VVVAGWREKDCPHVVHTNNAFIAGYETAIAAYEAEHLNVDIQLENFDYELYLQTLQTAMPAGEEADILQLFGTWTSQYYERLAPVPADVMTVAEAEEIFYGAPIGGFIVDGRSTVSRRSSTANTAAYWSTRPSMRRLV